MTLLFIPALLEGDVHAFVTKLAVMLFVWLAIPLCSSVDLASGIAASKRVGNKRTTSWGIRRTLNKLLVYFAVFFVALLLDIGTSVLGPFLSVFSVPIISSIAIIGEIIIEAMSIKENIQKGRDPEEDKIDDLTQLAMATVDAVGPDKVKDLLKAVKKYADTKNV